jgi:hypothetical protein
MRSKVSVLALITLLTAPLAALAAPPDVAVEVAAPPPALPETDLVGVPSLCVPDPAPHELWVSRCGDTMTGALAMQAPILMGSQAIQFAGGALAAAGPALLFGGKGVCVASAAPVGCGTVTNVGAGFGLTGGPITVAGTLAVDDAAIQRRVTGSCAGEAIQAIDQDGGVSCTAIGGPAWLLGGNAGTSGANFLGTTDEQPLEVRVHGQRGLLVRPASVYGPDVVAGGASNAIALGFGGSSIAGGSSNYIADPQAFIGSGEGNRIEESGGYGFIGGGFQNSATGTFAVVAGGSRNAAASTGTAIGGGQQNTATEPYASVLGGFLNTATGYASVVGGAQNDASGWSAIVGGGEFNHATGPHASVLGGEGNIAGGSHTFIGGGSGNAAAGANGTIGGGNNNRASGLQTTVAGGVGNVADGTASFVGGGSLNKADGFETFVGGGRRNVASGLQAAVGGGFENKAQAEGAAVAGGVGNNASAPFSVVAGGAENHVSAEFATVGGGSQNTASGDRATVGGGDSNTANGDRATVAGGLGNRASGPGSFVAGGESNTAGGRFASVGGGQGNIASGFGATASGGVGNRAEGENSTVGGGRANTALAEWATTAGGAFNHAWGQRSTVGGGSGNKVTSYGGTIGGGEQNLVEGWNAVVAGGAQNRAAGPTATVAGGNNNTASQWMATVPGGQSNQANGGFSFAAGRHARADHAGAFVWADSRNWAPDPVADFASTGNDQFLIRAQGGVGIGTNAPAAQLDVRGASTANSYNVPDGQEDLRVLSSDNRPSDGGILTIGGAWGPTGYIKTAARIGTAGDLILGNRRASSATTMEPGLVLTMDGNVGIGTASPADKLHVAGELRVNSCVKNSAGSAIAGSCSSDARLKQNVQPFGPTLERLAQLQPVEYDWRAAEFPERHFGTQRSYGLIAQDVQALFPEMTGHDDQGYLTVDYTRLPLLLLQGVRELQRENEELRGHNALLEDRLAALEAALGLEP